MLAGGNRLRNPNALAYAARTHRRGVTRRDDTPEKQRSTNTDREEQQQDHSDHYHESGHKRHDDDEYTDEGGSPLRYSPAHVTPSGSAIRATSRLDSSVMNLSRLTPCAVRIWEQRTRVIPACRLTSADVLGSAMII